MCFSPCSCSGLCSQPSSQRFKSKSGQVTVLLTTVGPLAPHGAVPSLPCAHGASGPCPLSRSFLPGLQSPWQVCPLQDVLAVTFHPPMPLVVGSHPDCIQLPAQILRPRGGFPRRCCWNEHLTYHRRACISPQTVPLPAVRFPLFTCFLVIYLFRPLECKGVVSSCSYSRA